MVRIGDQHGLGRKRTDAHDLADDALGVDQRLADVHAVDQAAIQVEALAVGIQVHVENLCDQRAVADARLRVEQRAEARILHLERREPLQAKLGVQPLALEESFSAISASRAAKVCAPTPSR